MSFSLISATLASVASLSEGGRVFRFNDIHGLSSFTLQFAFSLFQVIQRLWAVQPFFYMAFLLLSNAASFALSLATFSWAFSFCLRVFNCGHFFFIVFIFVVIILLSCFSLVRISFRVLKPALPFVQWLGHIVTYRHMERKLSLLVNFSSTRLNYNL